MTTQFSPKQNIRIRVVTRHYLICDRNLESAKAFVRLVCRSIGIDVHAEPPSFLSDRSMLTDQRNAFGQC